MTKAPPKVDRICRQCGAAFSVARAIVSRGPNWGVFCTTNCKARSQEHGNTRDSWRNATVGPNGYMRVSIGRRGVSEHVLIAERALGRRLPKGAVVHHVDGNRANNAASNLVICQDHRYHMLLHMRAKVAARGFDPNSCKRCSACDAIKPLSAFWRYHKFVDGYENKCKACRSRQRMSSRQEAA